MKLLLFSDIHADLAGAARLVELAADVDLVIAAGDFAVKHDRLAETIDVLRAIETPTVAVPGNNETDAALAAACAAWPAATVCHGSGAEVAGRTVFGLGGGIPPTPWDWSFDVDEAAASDALADCPDGALLVVHSPPRGHLDGAGGAHHGSVAILEAIERRRPPLVVCGHIHECWEQESRIGDSLVINPGPAGRVLEL
jgi:Icc-related predicted phosphoesterase